MTSYIPDSWVVLKITGNDPHYRILAAWAGGYLHGDSWRLNSGIVSVVEGEDSWDFYGSSASLYRCSKRRYGLRSISAGVYEKLVELRGDKIELLSEDTDWNSIDWILRQPGWLR